MRTSRSAREPDYNLFDTGQNALGTARWQKEAAEQAEQECILAEVERKRREVALARLELGARIEALEQES